MLSDKELVFLKQKYPLHRIFASPSIHNPAILHLLLEAIKIRELLELTIGEIQED